jgi:hypothetical protein
MTYGVCNLPLSLANYITEVNTIKHLANINGYKEYIIDRMINKHNRRLNLRSLTTLQYTKESDDLEYRKFSFSGDLSYKLSSIFKKHHIKTVFTNDQKLKNLLGNTKDKIENIEKAGIYKIECKECNDTYIGQTKRSIQIRFKEHLKTFQRNDSTTSSVAKHMISKKHTFDETNLKLVKHVRDPQQLDAFESIEILRQKPAMNTDNGPTVSSLFSLRNHHR